MRPADNAPGAGAPRSRPRRKVVIAAVTLLVVVAGICVGLVVFRHADGTRACPTQPLNASATQRYTADPVTVIGPAGWLHNIVGGLPDLQDYSPSRTESNAPYMRIGILNRDPASTMPKEADSQASSILAVSGFKNSKIVQKTLCRFLGVDAADIEYTGTNSSNVDRHGIERLWIRDGKTLMLRYSTPADQWSRETFYGLARNTSDH